MRRLLFTLLAGSSLLLSLVAGAAWVLSYARPMLNWHSLRADDPAAIGRTGTWVHVGADASPGGWRAWWAASENGRLTLVHQHAKVPPDTYLHAPTALEMKALSADSRNAHAYPLTLRAWERPSWSVLGFRYRPTETPPAHAGVGMSIWAFAPRMAITELSLPYWFLVLISLPMPLLWLRVNRRSRRWARRGLCAGCGYDLRETPDRCPECGRVNAGVPSN